MILAICLFLSTNFAINAGIAARHAMGIYVTKNGQQLGPYTMAEAQNLLRSGTLAATDLAWREGLPNWIPLYQVPGFVLVPPAPPPPPVATTTPEQAQRLPAQNKSLLQKIGTGIVAIGVILFKSWTLIFVLAKTVGTMLLSIGAYSLFWGWKFAAGLVLLIFVHEMGHFISARCYRIPVTAPTFIPFVGAYVLLKNRPMDSWSNAIISYAGPLAGGLGGWACYYLAGFYGEEWIMAVALYTFIINLFNLLPIPPLDGSHIWICFWKKRTPDMRSSDRLYLGIFVAALIAGLVLGCMYTWGNLPPPSSLTPR